MVTRVHDASQQGGHHLQLMQLVNNFDVLYVCEFFGRSRTLDEVSMGAA